MTTAKKILDLATSQIGIKEIPANSNNVKYNTEYYGRKISGSAYPWCCAFVWWCFKELGASPLFYGGKKTASCSTLNSFHRKNGQAVTDYLPGDVVFFDFSGKKSKTEHVGIVESCLGENITTIDGNTGTTNEANGGAVMCRTRSLKYVTCGYRPQYTVDNYEEDENMTQEKFTEMMNDYLSSLAKQEGAAWSKDAREWAEEAGLIKGDENGNAQWKSFMTREQMVTIMQRMSEK